MISDDYKRCEISDCGGQILSRHRQDEGGHLCAVHFYALASIEGRMPGLVMQDGPPRRYFLNAARLIGEAHRTLLLTWREKNPAAVQ